jgi:hypothetical protein
MKTLLYHEPVSVAIDCYRDLVEPHFNLEKYNPGQEYDPADTLVVIPFCGAGEWAFDLHDRGFRIAVDNLWEPTSRYLASPGYDRLDPAHTHEIRSDLWFWYMESLRYPYYREPVYVPQRTYKKLAFMPMRQPRDHRGQLLTTMAPWLDDFYYSYQHLGLSLPWDLPYEDPVAQRYYDARWYDDTWFSIVAESYVDEYNTTTWGTNRTPYLGPWPFITEKTFKPIALRHPFMVYGHSGTLARLHELGFETFPEMFDESYDRAGTNKIEILKNNVAQFDRSAGAYSQIVLDKLEHNYQLFSNTDRVEQGFYQDIIEPLLTYAEST